MLESWTRSRSFGVDPEADGPPVELTGQSLVDYREKHPLGAVMPVVRQLLVAPAAADDLIVAVSDADGTLLWVEGARAARGRAEQMRFTEGARWDERHAGTNAPGLALAVDRGVHVQAAEHWARPVRPWSCSASPVHDPADGRVLGAVDVTGDARAASRGVFALIAATVAAAERELEIAWLRAASRAEAGAGAGAGADEGVGVRSGLGHQRAPAAVLRLSVLRSGSPVLTVRGRQVPVSLRHAELLLLLAEHPEGMTAEALAVQLDERALDPVTVRAEMTRLRRVVGPDVVCSRPYRLGVRIATDVADVRRLLAGSELRAALGVWSGSMLPRSQAPGVAAVRERLREEARVALLRRADPALLLRWADGPDGGDDLEIWDACRRLLPAGPDRDRALARVRILHREFGPRSASR